MSGAPVTRFPLCDADDATFWPWLSSAEFRRWPSPEKTVVVLPLAGLRDAGDGSPLDSEETALLSLLRDASRALAPGPWLLVLPPLRFVLGPGSECVFAIDPPLAHALIEEWVVSAAAAGFRKFLLFNASPYNEELCAAAARDLHVERGYDMFVLNLSALGAERSRLAALLAELRDWTPPPPSR